jgi:formylglycine-generating enzyme required for sulfatase activity
MGTNDKESFPNERPAHLVQVQGFWMDEYDVTNAEFSNFVEATGPRRSGAAGRRTDGGRHEGLCASMVCANASG